MAGKQQAKYKMKAPAEIVSFIRGAHPQLKRKIKAALQRIVADPSAGKFLKDDLQGLRSFRIGPVTIIYRLSAKHVIEIIAIGPRNIIYEETYRIIKKEKDA
jgi:mRNA-degrading endonuclease RelE of RelBE toxin-antitoxin system